MGFLEHSTPTNGFCLKPSCIHFTQKKQKLGRPRHRKWHETCSHIAVLADPGSTPRVTSNSMGAEKSLSERPWIKTDGIFNKGQQEWKVHHREFLWGYKDI